MYDDSKENKLACEVRFLSISGFFSSSSKQSDPEHVRSQVKGFKDGPDSFPPGQDSAGHRLIVMQSHSYSNNRVLFQRNHPFEATHVSVTFTFLVVWIHSQ